MGCDPRLRNLKINSLSDRFVAWELPDLVMIPEDDIRFFRGAKIYVTDKWLRRGPGHDPDLGPDLGSSRAWTGPGLIWARPILDVPICARPIWVYNYKIDSHLNPFPMTEYISAFMSIGMCFNFDS